MKKSITLFAAWCLLANTTFAAEFQSLTVKRMFSESSTTAGFYPSEDISATCLYGIIYIDLSTESGKAQLSIVLAAKVSEWELSRVNYTVNPSGTCTATGIHAG